MDGNDYVFSWAEGPTGRMVNIDDVPNGLACQCKCPSCHEKLLARHGKVREHGFAHHSKTRQARLEICYMVILYKLAEQIIFDYKQIKMPSYYSIFPSKVMVFEKVEIDSRFEREDKQPDVIATTSDGQKYLIEFVFNGKAQHKQPVNHKEFNCVEINLSGQTLESLQRFLLESSKNRRWINNPDYFSKIEDRYSKEGKYVRVVSVEECCNCPLQINCAAVCIGKDPLIIENDCMEYKLCKQELYNTKLDEYKRKRHHSGILQKERAVPVKTREELMDEYTGEVSCVFCESRIEWASNDNVITCGAGTPHTVNPDAAIFCKRFKPSIKWL